MNDYKNIVKIKPEDLLSLAREVLDKSADFEYISGVQPFLMSFKGEQFYVYIKNISSAYFSDRDRVTRAQLPIKPEFNAIKKSDIPFIFLGYDDINDVLVCWNFHVAKERLNVGKSVSFYSRTFFQSEVKEGEFSRRLLKNGDLPVLFKRSYFVEFFVNVHSFFTAENENLKFTNVVYSKDSLEFAFCSYLRNDKKLSEKSISNYSNALKGRISTGIKNYFLPEMNSIYFIADINHLLNIKDKLFATSEYEELNRIGKNMYSCAFDNYIEFISERDKLVEQIPLPSKKVVPVNGKLLAIEDPELLAKLAPYLNTGRTLSAAQIIGEYYQDQYPSMEFKDWMALLSKLY